MDNYGVSEGTVRWQNSLTRDQIKVGQTLEILPVTGISHKVQKGDTVYSIAKKYDTFPQAVVDFPYNAFVNDEIFIRTFCQASGALWYNLGVPGP